MDKLTIIGLLVAVIAIFGGQFLEGGSFGALINPAAFVIVVGGSFGAVMVQTHTRTFIKGIQLLAWVFKTPVQPIADGVEKMVSWSQIARRDGLLGLEKNIDPTLDGYILKGLNMLVDGNNSDAIRGAMYVEHDVCIKELLNASKIYESLGGYSPTVGIIGAVLGLIHVMGNLANPELLGAGIATAFVATIYGVGFANLFFLPVYHKLKAIISEKSKYMEMMLEGIASIAEGENPRVIRTKLEGYLSK